MQCGNIERSSKNIKDISDEIQNKINDELSEIMASMTEQKADTD
jgi:hypothetical protein